MSEGARLSFTSVICVVALLMSSVALASTSNKWRLQFSGEAHSDGTITIQFTPKGGEPIVTETAIKDDTDENAVAHAVVRSLKKQLPRDGYHVESDDGEDVLIKKRDGAAEFGVELISNTVKNVRINLDRE